LRVRGKAKATWLLGGIPDDAVEGGGDGEEGAADGVEVEPDEEEAEAGA